MPLQLHFSRYLSYFPQFHEVHTQQNTFNFQLNVTVRYKYAYNTNSDLSVLRIIGTNMDLYFEPQLQLKLKKMILYRLRPLSDIGVYFYDHQL